MHPHDPVTRREALKAFGMTAVALGLSATAASAAPARPAATQQPFALPKLDYAYDALEPHIDARTMEIHHTKHHQAYIDNANKALAGHSSLRGMSAENIVRRLGAVPESVRTTLRNNVGGHLNHALFWRVIGPKAGGTPRGPLGEAITETFGSFDTFKSHFTDAAMKRFGSGWAWLVRHNGKLAISSTANQDTPLSEGATPLLGLDVWEHAYYLKYQNRRAEYIAAFWNVVNWDAVTENYKASE